ncbi:hypothetical protein [Corallococcus macrosporus]|uniref:AttH domain-containing protein n=1 Tax=Corallococcus macrosporus DSM 14697 TaxID=1189310 RepID=A0A250JWC0_9BACT|nr:hypothetical protein [Corallococcus macrosporus]ATB48135.1 hypothetical protein MYMAC_003761 [Corallococcus macrosporus DSM 14697]
MPSSEHANLPRWKGQQGFFEIWFLCVLDPGGERAWWFRYTRFTPAPGAPGEPRAMLWAAAFDCASATPALGLKAIHPLSRFSADASGPFGIRLGDAELAPGRCHGRVASGGHSIDWDLRYTPASSQAVRRAPRGSDLLPLPTHVAHAHDDITFTGTVTVDGHRYDVQGAPGLQKHLWGHRRLEELTWLYVPRFQEDPDARLEVLSVRARRHALSPRLSPIYLRTAQGEHRFHEAPELLFTRLESPHAGELRFQARSATVTVKGRAWCDPKTLVGYVYRDPAGWDVHVAQSDVATCELERFTRPHPFAAWKPEGRLTSTVGALEFHAPEPLEGVRYIGWDETCLSEPGALPSTAAGGGQG